MSRGPPPRRALADAIPIARQRGTVQVARIGSGNLYNFSIISAIPVVFVRVSYCTWIQTPVAELEKEFEEELILLRQIVTHEALSRELWLRSRHGTWRFFRLSGEILIELGRDGKPLIMNTLQAGKPAVVK
jgi:hypothetical protein